MNYTSLLRPFSNTDSIVQQWSWQVVILKWWSPPFNNVQEIRGSPWYRGFCRCSVCVMLRWTYKCMEEESIKCYLSGKFPPSYQMPERQILVPTKVFREILLSVYSDVCAILDVWFWALLKAGTLAWSIWWFLQDDGFKTMQFNIILFSTREPGPAVYLVNWWRSSLCSTTLPRFKVESSDVQRGKWS